MDAEIWNLLLKFPPSPARARAKLSAACLPWLRVACRLLLRCLPGAETKGGGFLVVRASTFPFSGVCLFVVELH